jgi:dTDP-4-dehydrorhamnose reductase
MKIAVIGANGQLGRDVAQAFADNGNVVLGLSHAEIEISDIDSVATTLGELRPELIVNTAAMHHVEKCEQDPESAFVINALGARNLALAAQELKAIIVHISTDYVFDGDKTEPYQESDAPRPLNTYGNTKLAGEYFVRSNCERHFVLRTSGLYGKNPCRGKGGLNFVDLMLKLGKERGKVRVVDTEKITPTSTRELAHQIVRLSSTDKFGLYHATAEGSCSWYDFAREIFTIAGMQVTVEKADAGEFPSKVSRPSYSVLENTALKAIGANSFLPWEEGLGNYLANLSSSTVKTERQLLQTV